MEKKYERKLLTIDWFSKMGEKDFNNLECFPIRFECLKGKAEMEKKISSLRWENKRIEEQSVVTTYLFKNHREKRKMWNTYAEEARNFIDMYLINNWKNFQREHGLSEKFIHSVMWNTLHYLIVSKFSEEIDEIPTFFLDLIRIYESGHIPCGWSGKNDKGFLFIY